jgi:hypothetical protein
MPKQDLRIKLTNYQGEVISRHNNWASAELAAERYGDCELVDRTGERLRYGDGKPLGIVGKDGE